MATVGFYFSVTSPKAFPFSEAVYTSSYEAFYSMAKQKYIDVRFILGEQLNTLDEFPSYYIFKSGELVKIHERFKSDVLLLRSRTHAFDHLKRVNNTYLERICRDKLLTYDTFSKYFKRTVLINPNDLSNLAILKTQKIVLKPRSGSGGKDVRVVHKSEISKDFVDRGEYIAQEVIESSDGISGLIERRHELRLYIFNGKIAAGYLRLPAPHSYMSNISQGAKEFQFPFSKMPTSAFDVVADIDKKFEDVLPRLYTVDLMYERQKPYIVELNDMPGTPDILVQPLTNKYFEALLDLLADAA